MKGKQIRRIRPVPGLSREDEEKQLKQIIDIAQENLTRAEERVTDLCGELHELMETYGTKDKEALAMFHNTQSQLHESRRDLVRCRKARRKPYFGRIISEIPISRRMSPFTWAGWEFPKIHQSL